MRIASRDVLALLVLGENPCIRSIEAVAGDLPAGLLHGGDRFRVARQRRRDAIDGERHVARGEQPPQPPEAGARAIFVDRLHVHVALARPGLRADDLRQERLGGRVAMQDVVLAALLVVEHELHGDPRAARPFRVGRVAAVADDVARIGGVRHEPKLSGFGGADHKPMVTHRGAISSAQTYQEVTLPFTSRDSRNSSIRGS